LFKKYVGIEPVLTCLQSNPLPYARHDKQNSDHNGRPRAVEQCL
jgi:hypothetical protein